MINYLNYFFNEVLIIQFIILKIIIKLHTGIKTIRFGIFLLPPLLHWEIELLPIRALSFLHSENHGITTAQIKPFL